MHGLFLVATWLQYGDLAKVRFDQQRNKPTDWILQTFDSQSRTVSRGFSILIIILFQCHNPNHKSKLFRNLDVSVLKSKDDFRSK